MSHDFVARLEEWKSRFGGGNPEDLHRLLHEAPTHELHDSDSLIRLHECLLFLRAYPADAEVMRLAEAALSACARRIAASPDPAPFEDSEVSGIAGTSFSAVFSYDVARALAAHYPRHIEIDWENYDSLDKLGPVLRRLVPLVNEDWPVEAHVPFRAWVDAVRPPNRSALQWLLESIAELPLGPREQADLYDSLALLLVWKIGNAPAGRTRMRLPVRKPFFHTGPLIARRDVSLAAELEAPPLPVTRLSRPAAVRILDRILDNSAMRYRELYGFTHPDPAHVYRADAGRGVTIVFFGIPREWRLPLRAYHAGMFFKNGVPAGYVEVLSLCERAEVGFNLYYTFREGESAWIYARLLRLFRQMLGVTCFSVDPYQAGYQNDEAIQSGAFWFYRKLGFRPLDPAAARLSAREENRMRRTPGYRSSPQTLAKLGDSYLLYECGDAHRGDWDRFRIRNLALRCATERAAGELLRRMQRNKNGPEEFHYLRLTQRNASLRAAIIELGSSQAPKKMRRGETPAHCKVADFLFTDRRR
ncbi:MAG: hypothetical protein ABSH50_28580 [Bryobacteraceae bacterium]|jgi:hypothetical protein